ncbi:MAG TPA: cytochrome c-type biogenesis protein CcmH, partial [Ktedonobacteraceae bacterium]|nr:cytochrome c-type biogenesis protein CcmH [Ktedonobacteraceae bacterium]
GNQILLTPPPQGFNLLAWLAPVAMLLIGLGLLTFVARDWRRQELPQLATSAGEESAEPQIDPELEQYRVQLEQELADDDSLMEIE